MGNCGVGFAPCQEGVSSPPAGGVPCLRSCRADCCVAMPSQCAESQPPGFVFAELRPFLLDLMEAVEDIPGSALQEGIQWEYATFPSVTLPLRLPLSDLTVPIMARWETFPEYLDALGRREFACDVAVMVGHGGVRTWVMGKRANVSDMPGGPAADPVSDEEIRTRRWGRWSARLSRQVPWDSPPRGFCSTGTTGGS